MTKIGHCIGLSGRGKTTLIKKMLSEAYQGEKLVLIENEFGEISIDGGFLKDSGVQIRMTGCKRRRAAVSTCIFLLIMRSPSGCT